MEHKCLLTIFSPVAPDVDEALLGWFAEEASHLCGNLYDAICGVVSKEEHGPRRASRGHYGIVDNSNGRMTTMEAIHNIDLVDELLDEELYPFLHKVLAV